MINVLIPGITAIITLAFAFLVLIKSPRKRSNQLLSLGALAVLICLSGLIGFQLAKSKEMVILWSQAIFFGIIIFPPIGIAFGQAFLNSNFPELKRKGWAYVWIYFGTSLFFLLLLPGRGIVKNILLTQYGPIFEFTVFGKMFLIYFLLSLIHISINLEPIFVSAFQNTAGAVNAVKGIAISFIGALLFMIGIGAQMFLGANVPFWMLWLECCLIAAVFVAYGYFEIQRAMNKIFLSSRMVYSSVLLLGTGVYFLLLGISGYFVEYSNHDWRSHLFILSILGVCVLFLMTLFSNKVKNRIKSFWKRNVYQKKFDFREEWKLFSQKIANTLDLKVLSDNMVCHLGELFKIQEVGLYLKTNSGSSYELIAAWENKSKFPKKLTLNGLFLDNLDLKLDSKYNHKSREKFYEGSFGGFFSTIVPLIVEGKVLGILCIGDAKKAAQEILDLLSLFADQAALAIHNIQITSKLIEV
ncbi:MAG: GAF domain-containing protein, partial [bacterium]